MDQSRVSLVLRFFFFFFISFTLSPLPLPPRASTDSPLSGRTHSVLARARTARWIAITRIAAATRNACANRVFERCAPINALRNNGLTPSRYIKFATGSNDIDLSRDVAWNYHFIDAARVIYSFRFIFRFVCSTEKKKERKKKKKKERGMLV